MYVFILWAHHLFTVTQDSLENDIALAKGDQIIVENSILQYILQRKGVSNTLSIHDASFWVDEKFLNRKNIRSNDIFGGDITPDMMPQPKDFLIPVKIKYVDNSERKVSLSISYLLSKNILKSTIKNPYMNNAPNCNHKNIGFYASELWKDKVLRELYTDETLREEQGKCAKFLTLVGPFLTLDHLSHYCKVFFKENFNCPKYWRRVFGNQSVEDVVKSYIDEEVVNQYNDKPHPIMGILLPESVGVPSEADITLGEVKASNKDVGRSHESYQIKTSSPRSIPLSYSIGLQENLISGNISNIFFPTKRGVLWLLINQLPVTSESSLNEIYQQYANKCNPSEINQYIDSVSNAFNAEYDRIFAKVSAVRSSKEIKKYTDSFKNFNETAQCINLLAEIYNNDQLSDRWIRKYCSEFILPDFNCADFWHKNFADASMDEIVGMLSSKSNVVSCFIMQPFFDIYIHSRYLARILNLTGGTSLQGRHMSMDLLTVSRENSRESLSPPEKEKLWNSVVIVGQNLFKLSGWIEFGGSTIPSFVSSFAE